MSHTPGPWKADIRAGCFAVYPAREDHNCMIGMSDRAIVYQSGRGQESAPGAYRFLSDEQEANARLIAAAPELLEACRRALVMAEPYEGVAGCGEQQSLCQHLRTAIAKATGKGGQQ